VTRNNFALNSPHGLLPTDSVRRSSILIARLVTNVTIIIVLRVDIRPVASGLQRLISTNRRQRCWSGQHLANEALADGGARQQIRVLSRRMPILWDGVKQGRANFEGVRRCFETVFGDEDSARAVVKPTT
jgi:hypothetical protein